MASRARGGARELPTLRLAAGPPRTKGSEGVHASRGEYGRLMRSVAGQNSNDVQSTAVCKGQRCTSFEKPALERSTIVFTEVNAI